MKRFESGEARVPENVRFCHHFSNYMATEQHATLRSQHGFLHRLLSMCTRLTCFFFPAAFVAENVFCCLQAARRFHRRRRPTRTCRCSSSTTTSRALNPSTSPSQRLCRLQMPPWHRYIIFKTKIKVKSRLRIDARRSSEPYHSLIKQEGCHIAVAIFNPVSC